MAISKSISLADILVPDRLRAVDDDYALAIQASICRHGLLHPITVRATPAAKSPYTLVAGAHRYRAIALLLDGPKEIDAIVVKADKDVAILIEIEETLVRNDLSVMDRAVFVQTYRDLWETTRGKIQRGGDRRSGSKGHVDPLKSVPADLVAQEAANGFSTVCANRLGVSVESIKRLNRIAQNLPREVRSAISGTTIADNQSQLLKLARLAPEKRAKAHIAIREAKGEFRAALDLLEPPAKKPDPELQILSRLIDSWERAKPATRKKFLTHACLVTAPKGGTS